MSCPEIEKQSLLSFKQSLHDPNNSLSSWDGDGVNCCKWKGVLCDNLTGHVHQLRLQVSNLSGKISPSLLNLKHLKYLDLSGNHFHNETIPPFIGSLTSLEYLNLSFADFHGKIPRNIGNLSNLHTLSLEDDFSLDVDSLEWLSRLAKLKHLNMNSVNLNRASHWQQQVINNLPCLVELHLSYCNLDFAVVPLSDVNNITTSKLAILDLSGNYNLQSSGIIVLRWIFHLSNLIHLDLSSNNYAGPIPSVSNTTRLKYIDLSDNQLDSGNIPEWLYYSKDLEFLSFRQNNLQDTIFNSIANLTSLRNLDLSENELSGKLPRGITNLCKLQKLSLGGNNFQGVSNLFGNVSDCFLRALESLVLSDNQFSGPLTDQFGKFKSLRFLDLSVNSFSGVIPSNIGKLSFLEELDLRDNQLSGNLPESMGQLSNLHSLDIENNMLEGVVTEAHFSHLSRLEYLSASENHLTLKVNPNWIPPFELRTLHLGSWNLDSPFPSWLLKMSTIEDLDLSNTGIYGNVPRWIWSTTFLNLSFNQLHGNITVLSTPPNVAMFVYLSGNHFSGQLPRLGNKMWQLDLSNNSFSGDLSGSLCNGTTSLYELQYLHLEGNHLTGELPANCFMQWSSLRTLNLGNNNLSGRIPNSIGFLADLETLNLHGNNFSGDIPVSIGSCTQLTKIDLSHNNLSGNLANWIPGSISDLLILILKSNMLSGEITSPICQLRSLQILDLSNNMFSGIIPTCVDNFTAMKTKKKFSFSPASKGAATMFPTEILESTSIATKGNELTYDINLPLVTSIDLSKNNLSGNIPKEITSLVELKSLNLSQNHLTGSIPYTIGNMEQLESLDLSINSLSGELPNSFRSMSFLSYLNVSLNNLTGRIPESTQLCGFNESSFIGNNFWGPPLSSSCSAVNDVETPGTMQSKDEESDQPEIEWLYVFISLGYAVGLSALLTTLFLKRSWREAYYGFAENMWDIAYVYVHIEWRRLTTALGRNM